VHYDFLVVLFGLINAPSTFMCLIKIVFFPYMDKLVIVFVDDILVYTRNKEDHAKHLATILRLLGEHKLYFKMGKCSLFKSYIHYLGHVVCKDGMEMDQENIKAIMEWAIPMNADEVRSFMELTNYYGRFIKNFSKIGYPIKSL